MEKAKRIIITDKKHGLPFSKGLLATSIMSTGIIPKKAYHVAELVEKYFHKNSMFTVNSDTLKKAVVDVLRKAVGPELTDRYIKWQSLGRLEKPLIILVGGTTGVGKSTIAAEVAHRLAITRIVSTDAIREVMRAVFSRDLNPPLYESSFKAWEALRTPIPKNVDPITIGFMEQTATVSLGVKAVVERAISENLDMVVEGIHIVPGFLDLKSFQNAFVVPLVIGVEDENMHQSHFYVRGMKTRQARPYERYKANFHSIRMIGDYIGHLAKRLKVPIIQSVSLDATILTVLDEIYSQVYSMVSAVNSEIVNANGIKSSIINVEEK